MEMEENNELVNYKNQEGNYQGDRSVNMSRQTNMKKHNQRVKPKFFKLLGQVMNLHVEVK